MKFFIHRDKYDNDEWWYSFKLSCEEFGYEYEIINCLDSNFSFPENISENDWLLARFGHSPTDKKIISDLYQDLYKYFNGNIFPNPISYKLYDDKWKEYKFLRENNLPTPFTILAENRSKIFDYLSSEKLKLPIVTKKKYGAGSEFVDRWDNVIDIPESTFPCLVQNYIEVDFDIRLNLLYNVFTSNKRLHKEGGSFPYGGDWFEVSTHAINDEFDYLNKDFVKSIWDVFVNKNDIPISGVDIIIDSNNNPYILEFSYCFVHHISQVSNHWYTLPDLKRFNFYERVGGDIERYISDSDKKRLTTDKVIEWIENERM